MLRSAIVLVGLLMITALTATSADLYKVTVSSQTQAELLNSVPAEGILTVPDGYLVLMENETKDQLMQAGLQLELLVANVSRSDLALDISHNLSNADKYPVVYAESRTRVLRVDLTTVDITGGPPGLAPLMGPLSDFRYADPSDDVPLSIAATEDLNTLIGLVSQDSLVSYLERLQAFTTRYVGTDSNLAAREWLFAKFQEFGYDSVYVDSFSQNVLNRFGYPDSLFDCGNVVAVKPGSLYPEHQIVVGAHFDAVPNCPGADDNGTGTVGVLEIARVLKNIDTKLTMVFVPFDSEEWGLWGAWHYATGAAGRGDSIVLMINMDMLGDIKNTDQAYVCGALSYGHLWETFADSLAGIGLTAHVLSSNSWDDLPFYESGYKAIVAIEYEFSDHYHQNSDSTTYVSYDYLKRMIQTCLATAYVAGDTYVPSPQLLIDFPDGAPDWFFPAAPYTLPVTIEEYAGATLVGGSAVLNYSINGAEYVSSPLVDVGGDTWQAVVPATTCDSRMAYYVSAQENGGTVFTQPSPEDPAIAGFSTHTTVIFEDDFQSYLGWSLMGDAAAGIWERREPQGGGWYSDPPGDYDGSGLCYVTGNDIEDNVAGTTILRSPPFDLSQGNALVEFAFWSCRRVASDGLSVYASGDNGTSWSLVKAAASHPTNRRGWYTDNFMIGDYVAIGPEMRVRFDAADLGSDNNVEAAIDAVSVTLYWTEPAPAITTETLPPCSEGTPVSLMLVGTGGYGAITFDDKNDDLFATGLTLATDGTLSGTSIAAGDIVFTSMVTDEIARTDEKLLTLTVNPSPVVVTEALPEATSGESYSTQLETSGGTGDIAWTDRDNDLSGTGLSLSSTGLLSGIPTDTGMVTFTAQVTDEFGATGDKPLTLHVEIEFICGDIDFDGQDLNISDLTFFVEYMFASGPPPPFMRAVDVNSSGEIDVSDLTFMVDYLFAGGPAPNCQ